MGWIKLQPRITYRIQSKPLVDYIIYSPNHTTGKNVSLKTGLI